MHRLKNKKTLTKHTPSTHNDSNNLRRTNQNRFVEIDHEIISTVILLPSAESFKKGCCQLQAKVCARSTG